MEINFDFLVSGCNTQCRHCYVNGGPAPLMSKNDAVLCIERLDKMAEYLPEGTSFTLDHEPMNHPQLDEILYASSHTKRILNFHHGMTTGLGLMRRKDKKEVIKSYFQNGYLIFGITLHGVGAHHDEIVRRNGAYEKTIEAAKFLLSTGAEVQMSFLFNRYFEQDIEELFRMKQELGISNVYHAVPTFTPHKNMKQYEVYRATVETMKSIMPYFMETEYYTAEDAIKYLNSFDSLTELFSRKQEELYLTVHQDCRLYIGNSGAETRCLGDLRTTNPEDTAKIIMQQNGNRDYTAFYDLSVLPEKDDVCSVLSRLPQNLVYGDMPSVIYRALAEMEIPTSIIDFSAMYTI